MTMTWCAKFFYFSIQKSVRNRQIEKLEKTKLQIIKLFGTLYAHAVCEHPST